MFHDRFVRVKGTNKSTKVEQSHFAFLHTGSTSRIL
jgi:hypothetical protein